MRMGGTHPMGVSMSIATSCWNVVARSGPHNQCGRTTWQHFQLKVRSSFTWSLESSWNTPCLTNCQACRNHVQAAFPALPRYTAPSSIVHLPHSQESVAGTTRKVLAELNKTYEEAFGQSFMEAVVQYRGRTEGIYKPKSKQEEEKEVRPMQQKFHDSVNEQYASTATITFLRGSQRKCLSQSLNFCQGVVIIGVTFLPM